MQANFTHSKRDRKSASSSPAIPAVVEMSPSQGDGTRAVLPPALAEATDAAVAEAFARSYTPDPLIPEAVASIRSPLDSVLRRHGLLIESAIATALELSGGVDVLVQVAVPISQAALDLCVANAPDKTAALTLPVGSAVVKTAILDIVAYYPETGRLVAASVKRGGGAQGGSAARQDRLDLRAAGMILRGMLTSAGRTVSSVEVITIDYYGRSGIISGHVVEGTALDAFFGALITPIVEAMTERMASAVSKRVQERLAALMPPTPKPMATQARETVAGATPVPGESIVVPMRPAAPLPTLAECLSSLPLRPQGRRMSAVGA
ncbi:hypothetical protein [Oharaeibacter diazotrophicus]|uniref:Uncharacterized protein n=1 Tax=Oharaeibacter diazotrophicus TaxID=1920512 RepID=A0A4R6RDI1_9HYPH|nr:hypothetical protein [Oharaeibacter diazotrophicus]TDP84240.1 hypothetical protein EDD54_2845 [Oharaeibacter diazotrophicus]BBE73278.1 hypothetical protein OHA_1_02887 [Pleomorphomonas sp. SM30]GLS75068.1 hypothetical protein GCM10007904_04030 [Oharaeibacter diazotrophicus]